MPFPRVFGAIEFWSIVELTSARPENLLFGGSQHHARGRASDDLGRLLGGRKRDFVYSRVTVKADYVDVSIMLSHDRCRAPTAHLERQAPILSST